MREIITNDIGEVKLGDSVLPGIFQSMDISGTLRFDEAEIKGQSGTSKQPLGFEDATINLNLILPTDEKATCYDRFKVFVAAFYKVNKYGRPYVYRLVNHLTDIWGVRDVLFKDLRVRDDNQKDSLSVDLVFQEYRPVVVKREAKAVPPGDLDPYTDFAELTEAATTTKTGIESPAKDDDTP